MENYEVKDAKYVVPSIILAVSLLLMGWFTWAIYIAIVFLSINSAAMILVTSTFLNSDLIPIKSEKKNYRNPMLQFFMHVISIIVLIQIYNAGFVFTSGFLSFMVAISFFANIISVLALRKGNE